MPITCPSPFPCIQLSRYGNHRLRNITILNNITGMNRGCKMLTERTHFSEQEELANNSRRSEQRLASHQIPVFFRKKGHKNGYATRPKTTFIDESLIIERYQPQETPHDTEHYQQMNQTLRKENLNLSQHNSFLVEQVKSMFEREKKYKRALLLSHEQATKLEHTNGQLARQLHLLTDSVVMEIQRIQQLIHKDQSQADDELKIFSREYRESCEAQGWDTDESVSANLENLKRQVSEMFSNQPSDFINQCEYKVNEHGRRTVFSLNSDNQSKTKGKQNQKSDYLQDSKRLSEVYSFQNLLSPDMKENFTININSK